MHTTKQCRVHVLDILTAKIHIQSAETKSRSCLTTGKDSRQTDLWLRQLD